MAQAEVARLYRSIQDDPTLRVKLGSAVDRDDFVNIARSCGYDFTTSEFLESVRFKVEELECSVSEIPGI